MSGGHWQYSGRPIQEAIELVGTDPAVQKRWPLTAAACMAIGPWFRNAEHIMDWDVSCDSHIDNDQEFDRQTFAALLNALLKIAPDAWFSRGKWATIQAVQGGAQEVDHAGGA